jgi:hypothetical protein
VRRVSIHDVLKAALEAVDQKRPLCAEELRHAHEVLSWRLAGYEVELQSVLEGYQLHHAHLDVVEELLVQQGVKPLADEDVEDGLDVMIEVEDEAGEESDEADADQSSAHSVTERL